MSYTVLARRYRSGTFDEVIGQDHVAQTLKKAIGSGRVAHAYLFCGTRGVGKTSMARILAKALNCHSSDGPTTEPCNKCDSCKAIARGDDIDVIEIDAASNTGVDNVRDVIENSQYRPARSRFKIYIIDEAHMLSKAAFNALLKTLEEPPSHVKFILATTEAEKLLPTILSRCQRYDFRNIPTREIAAHLANVCKQEKIKADEEALLLVAKAGAGSMRDSLSLLDRLLSVGEKHLTADMIEQLLGLPKSQLLFDLAEAIGSGDVKSALGQADAIVTGGLSPDSLIAAFVDHLRNLLILRTCGPDSTLVDVPGLALDDLVAQAAKFDPIALTQDITILEELRRTLRQLQAGRALLDATLVRMALSDQFASIGDLLSRIDGNGPAPTRPATRPPATPPEQKKNFELRQGVTPSPSQGEGRGEGGSARITNGADSQASIPAGIAASNTAIDSETIPKPVAKSEAAVAAHASPSPRPSPLEGEGGGAEDDDSLPAPGKVWVGPSESLSSLLAKHNAAAPPAAVPAVVPSSSADSNVEPVDAADLPAVWRAMLDLLSNHGPMLHTLVSQGRLVGLEQDRMVIRYGPQHATFIKQWEKNGKKDLIRDAASKVLNQSVGVKFEVTAEEPAAAPIETSATPPARKFPPRATAAPEPPPAPAGPPAVKITPELVESLRNSEPLVKSVMDKLGGQIIKVE
ncbi:MAG TPA: DNA polymerase III subunit gamma/tau [Tepidisphaeraceae bacterium]|jgi:DNA polymerase-3 subunit gamma/tau|nr:DNA polymerase III subunit gamma/tau [Tepidisphaeraceae bacterium]